MVDSYCQARCYQLDADANLTVENGHEFGAVTYGYGSYAIYIKTEGHTLTKLGPGTFVIVPSIKGTKVTGSGTVNIAEGVFSVKASDTSGKELDGSTATLNIEAPGRVALTRATCIFKNFRNNGTVVGTGTLKVTNTASVGTGVTSRLQLESGAKIKPDGTNYLRVSASLELGESVSIDVSGVNFADTVRIPLLKVDVASILPDASLIDTGALPEHWILRQTRDGLGYDIVKPIGFVFTVR